MEKVWSVLNFLYISSSDNNALKIWEADALLSVSLQDMDCRNHKSTFRQALHEKPCSVSKA